MSRWRIEGTLTTLSRLHIGSGETDLKRGVVQRERADAAEDAPKKEVEVSTVAADIQRRPILPAASLKGALRAWLKRRGVAEEPLDQAFGNLSKASGVTFRHGRYLAKEPPQVKTPHAWWNADRVTGVATSVAIDRARRAAADRKLFHYEFVPPGEVFNVVVEGVDAPSTAASLVLDALEGFNSTGDPVTLGAGGPAWGRMKWTPANLCFTVLDVEAVREWLKKPAGERMPSYLRGHLARPLIPRENLVAAGPAPASRGKRWLELDLKLAFNGSFLVNDPSQTRTTDPDRNNLPHFSPVRDEEGRPLLPSSSFRGVLRSRAEMILRTIHGDGGACREGLAAGPCPPVKEIENVKTLCPACRLFGSSGWRSPLSVLDFTLAHPPMEHTQDFLRIDRFTGSGANHLKFEGRAAVKPVYTGSVRLDLGAAKKAETLPWAMGLLALVLRDMADEEIPVGFGAGKGFGRMKLEVTGVRVDSGAASAFLFDGQAVASSSLDDLKKLATVTPDSPLGSALGRWITAIPARPPAKTTAATGGGR
jgi:CRISPR/Cas system CSM-associated protein Csm3 (group 7 of RAMP superfamily)